MALEDVCLHTATRVRLEKAGPVIEGEQDIAEQLLTPFACCLFLPTPPGQQDRQGRTVRQPTLLFIPEDEAGEPVLLGKEERLRVEAPELAMALGALETEWQVEGEPQPFGRPGDDVIGFQATLKRVDD